MIVQRTFDWVSHHDPRSRDYPVTAVLESSKPRSYTWACDTWLDQGREGACVGFAWSHEIAARPKVYQGITDADAHSLYRRAQQLDEWEGEAYSGSSVLAGAKAARERGFLKEFRWAFSVDDLSLAVGRRGPAVLGIPWHEGMYETNSKGFIAPTGRQVGGHAILCRAVNVREEFFTLRNSWGTEWGVKGDARISFDDLAKLLADGGEACIPTRR